MDEDQDAVGRAVAVFGGEGLPSQHFCALLEGTRGRAWRPLDCIFRAERAPTFIARGAQMALPGMRVRTAGTGPLSSMDGRPHERFAMKSHSL